jgi:hypothetical protein
MMGHVVEAGVREHEVRGALPGRRAQPHAGDAVHLGAAVLHRHAQVSVVAQPDHGAHSYDQINPLAHHRRHGFFMVTLAQRAGHHGARPARDLLGRVAAQDLARALDLGLPPVELGPALGHLRGHLRGHSLLLRLIAKLHLHRGLGRIAHRPQQHAHAKTRALHAHGRDRGGGAELDRENVLPLLDLDRLRLAVDKAGHGRGKVQHGQMLRVHRNLVDSALRRHIEDELRGGRGRAAEQDHQAREGHDAEPSPHRISPEPSRVASLAGGGATM